MPRQLRDTGRVVKVDDAFSRPLPEYDRRSGNHLWMISTVYEVDPTEWTGEKPDVVPTLSPSNLLTAVGPGCLHCEQAYNTFLARRRCTGPPDG